MYGEEENWTTKKSEIQQFTCVTNVIDLKLAIYLRIYTSKILFKAIVKY